MKRNIAAEVARLESYFPLPQRRRQLDEATRQTHRLILDNYVATGAPPAGLDPVHVEKLSDLDLVVSEAGTVVGAYPFSTRSTDHHLLIDNTVNVDAMCSIDAVAVSPVFGVSTRVSSVCAVSGEPITVWQNNGVRSHPETVRLGIRWQVPEGSASTSMCREMVFLADGEIAAEWANSGGEAAVYDLVEGVEFGRLLFSHLVA